jgi:putative heme transporter
VTGCGDIDDIHESDETATVEMRAASPGPTTEPEAVPGLRAHLPAHEPIVHEPVVHEPVAHDLVAIRLAPPCSEIPIPPPTTGLHNSRRFLVLPKRGRLAATLAGLSAISTGAAWAIYDERTTVRQGFTVLLGGHMILIWIMAAVGAQCLSMVAFALLQRCLLRAGGARLTTARLLSTAYLANAIAVAIPIVGPGMATAYTYRQLRARRVDPTIAKVALTLAGILSTTAFAAVVVLAALLSGDSGAAAGGAGGAITGLAAAGIGLVALRSPRGRAQLQRVASRALRMVQRILHQPCGDPTQLVAAAINRLSRFRLTPTTIGAALAWGVLNWIADASCLVLAIKAVGVPVPWHDILLVWAAGQGVSSFCPTPGGLGVVEITMTAALVAARMHPPDAIAAVLLYRIVTFKVNITTISYALRTLSRRHQQSRTPSPASQRVISDVDAQRLQSPRSTPEALSPSTISGLSPISLVS